ncbi:copper homeostasis protein CutC [Pseudactinotalea sp. HY158]|uniref:copper homeostasis protein CutC n=1 Tax=Pseudactinotalea sp. HY158 TaxID=2654547 RepID=UPI0018927C98|nr:copper homeostasis protein CutC [Pseudactinotalea sp. HY158]
MTRKVRNAQEQGRARSLCAVALHQGRHGGAAVQDGMRAGRNGPAPQRPRAVFIGRGGGCLERKTTPPRRAGPDRVDRRMSAVELAVQDVHGIETAGALRPDRIELCSTLGFGGVSPSFGLIEEATAGSVPVHVLIRPRAGDFTYGSSERRVIVRDARRAIEAGAAGIVTGGIVNGSPDLRLLDEVRQVIGRAELTFHRAFDSIREPLRVLEDLRSHGVTRILTSGGADRAEHALDRLALLVENSRGGIQVMAGGGVTAANAHKVLATGVDAIHGSVTTIVTGASTVTLGSSAGAGVARWETTDCEQARRLIDIARRGGRP